MQPVFFQEMMMMMMMMTIFNRLLYNVTVNLTLENQWRTLSFYPTVTLSVTENNPYLLLCSLYGLSR
ncbi:hypothetical protein T4B_4604 [Trichinella pseudospiralis]|uniref:Uncharacterized protein n=2 Tax=Trichinella pseudospiralis TaxID=6337 RepID=A0A0V1II10_TRIPS|nr:hypothetical protein T4D_6787 [Trichinella pseudospiralis]KRZ22387.1 hypothetical protein T4B_4604 [Trichinella pseudospiralis]